MNLDCLRRPMFWILLSATIFVPLSVGLLLWKQFVGVVQGGHTVLVTLVLIPFIIFHLILSAVALYKNRRANQRSLLGPWTSRSVAVFAVLHVLVQLLNVTGKDPIIAMIVACGFSLVVVLPLLLMESVQEEDANTPVERSSATVA